MDREDRDVEMSTPGRLPHPERYKDHSVKPTRTHRLVDNPGGVRESRRRITGRERDRVEYLSGFSRTFSLLR